MILQITGTTSGTSPYDIFLCDENNTSCFYISGLTNIPPDVYILTDNYFPGENVVFVKLIDLNGCIHEQKIVCGEQLFLDGFGFIFMDDNYFTFQ